MISRFAFWSGVHEARQLPTYFSYATGVGHLPWIILTVNPPDDYVNVDPPFKAAIRTFVSAICPLSQISVTFKRHKTFKQS